MKYVSAFLTLYREQNISRAATMLFITQQGLSRQISAMEKELGVKLFDRERLGVVPTQVCSDLYQYFERIYDEYLDALTVISTHVKENKRNITIAFAQGLSNSDSADFIFDYQREHPEISMKIGEWSQHVCIEQLLDNKVDLAFMVTPVDDLRLNVKYEKEGYMYAAMHKSHPLAQQGETIDFSLLDGENIITGAPENALRQMFDYFCLITNIHPHIIVASNYSVNYVNAMQENMGIATVSAPMAKRIHNNNIVIRKLDTPEKGKMLCCTTKNAEIKREVEDLIKYIRLHFEKNPFEYILFDG